MEGKILHLFIADDDPDDLLLFADAMKELPVLTKITTFDNGVDLMASLLDTNIEFPDLIFLDLNMPLMNGEECLADIRNEPRMVAIPVIIYSTYFDSSKVSLLKNKGADRYLQKPKSFSVLKSLLERCIDSFYGDAGSTTSNPDFIIKEKF